MFFLLEPFSYRLNHRSYFVVVVLGIDGTAVRKGSLQVFRYQVPGEGAGAGLGMEELSVESGR